MSFQTIRPQFKTLLDNSGLFQETSATPKMDFGGYPAAYVAPSDNEGDYDTTTENMRVYAFIIRMFYSTKSIGVATALTRLEAIVDSIVDDIDQDAYKTGSSRVVGKQSEMPTGYTWVATEATPSAIGEIEGEELIMAEIKVKVKILRDIS